jgi:hypothetical protein
LFIDSKTEDKTDFNIFSKNRLSQQEIILELIQKKGMFCKRPDTPKFLSVDKKVKPRQYFEMSHGKIIRNKNNFAYIRKGT